MNNNPYENFDESMYSFICSYVWTREASNNIHYELIFTILCLCAVFVVELALLLIWNDYIKLQTVI